MTAVKVYRVEGIMRHRLGDRQKFRIEVTALKPEHAVEQVLCELGSRHKLKRRHIKILKVEEIKPEEVTRPEILSLLSLDKIVVV